MKHLAVLTAAISVLVAPSCGEARGSDISVGAPAAIAPGTYFASSDVAPSMLTTISLPDVGSPLSSGSAIVVPGPGEATIYQSWVANDELQADRGVADGVPIGRASVRMRAKDGRVVVLSDSSLSFAIGVGPKPQLAVALAEIPRVLAGQRPIARLMVAPVGDDLRSAVTWTTTPGPYMVAAWAGDRLLVQRLPLHSEGPGDVVVFDGPGAARDIERDASVISVSPDAQRILTWSTASGVGELAVVDLASGKKEAALQTGWSTVTSAAWHGQEVAVGAVRDSRPLVATLKVGTGSFGSPHEMKAGTTGEWAAIFDLWISDGGVIGGVVWPVTTRAEPRTYGLLSCGASADTCSTGAVAVPFDQQFGRVRNPSRAASFEPAEEQR